MKVKVKVAQLCPTLWPHGLYSPWISPGKNTGVGSLSLLQGIFPTQGLNKVLLHCRRIIYQLSHKGSPRILVWVAYPFSSGSSWPRNRTGVSCIAGRFFTNYAMIFLNLFQKKFRQKNQSVDIFKSYFITLIIFKVISSIFNVFLCVQMLFL